MHVPGEVFSSYVLRSPLVFVLFLILVNSASFEEGCAAQLCTTFYISRWSTHKRACGFSAYRVQQTSLRVPQRAGFLGVFPVFLLAHLSSLCLR